MLGRQRDRLLERALPRLERLAVRAVDQVEVHVGVAGGARGGHRAPDALGRVQPLERPQHGRVERLRAHRQPGVAGIQQAGEGSLVEGVGVRLRRDLRVGRHVERRSAAPRSRHPRSSGRHRRRRASPEEDAGDLGAVPRWRRERDLAQQGAQVPGLQLVEARVGVEVAVAAAREAERHVHVDARAHFLPFAAPASSTRRAWMKASCGTSTLPTRRMRAFPFFCVSSSFRLRVMSPP